MGRFKVGALKINGGAVAPIDNGEARIYDQQIGETVKQTFSFMDTVNGTLSFGDAIKQTLEFEVG